MCAAVRSSRRTGFPDPPDGGLGPLLVGERVLHHLREVGVAEEFGKVAQPFGVLGEVPGGEGAPEVVGGEVLLTHPGLPDVAVEPAPVVRNTSGEAGR